MFHSHKWLPPNENRIQICAKCGLARPVPTGECEHQWEQFSSEKITHTDKTTGEKLCIAKVFIMACKKCGDMKTLQLNAKDY